MEKVRKAAQYRQRLDKTLLSEDLTNEEKIRALVKNQLLCSSQHEVEGHSGIVVEKRTTEVSNFLDMLRSVPLNENEAPKVHAASHPEWKLKQDTEQFRVMYREGIQGTPFHTLLAEGYLDGAVDECLCVSWESGLYTKWWPQIMIPSFKLTYSQVVKKVRDGEQISLLRVKVPWPLSAREAVVHYFEFDYAQEDLAVVLVNTISDVERVNVDTHGFSKDGIPEPKDVVRIDVVGGYAIQKVTPTRSYFRIIARLDLKLDFVPPALINFIARQLLGTGFKLYEKTVVSAFKKDDDFRNALAAPLYVRIRKALPSNDEPNGVMEQDELILDKFSLPDEHSHGSDGLEDLLCVESESSEKMLVPAARKTFGEIVEEDNSEDDVPVETFTSGDQALHDRHGEKSLGNGYTRFSVSPKVGEALGTLDRVIHLIQKQGFYAESKVAPCFPDRESSKPLEEVQLYSIGEVCAGVPQKEVAEKSSQEPINSASSRDLRSSYTNTHSNKSNLHKIVSEIPEQDRVSPNETRLEAVNAENMLVAKMQVNGNGNGNGGAKSGKRAKHMLCCFR